MRLDSHSSCIRGGIFRLIPTAQRTARRTLSRKRKHVRGSESFAHNPQGEAKNESPSVNHRKVQQTWRATPFAYRRMDVLGKKNWGPEAPLRGSDETSR